jgi:nucleoside-diphosphate-sugar epimerase
MSARSVVFGASGFVGRAIAGALRDAGFTVVAAGRHPADGPWHRFEVVDITRDDQRWPVEAGDVVVNAAGLAHDMHASRYSPGDLHATNADGAGRVAAAAAAAGAAVLVHLSSVKAMTDTTPDGPVDESAGCWPTTPYGKAKLDGERLVTERAGDVPAANLRLTPVYGPGSKGNLDRLVRLAEKRWAPLLPKRCGERSMVHVDDVAALVVAIARQPASFTAIVSDGERYSPREIQDRVVTSTGGRRVPLAVPRAALRAAGAVGSAAQQVTKRDMPFSAADAGRLLDDALYERRVVLPVDWAPMRNLWDSLDHASP